MTLTEIVLTEFLGFLRDVANKAIWIVLVYWVVQKIVKEMPKWISQYSKIKAHENKLAWAKSIK